MARRSDEAGSARGVVYEAGSARGVIYEIPGKVFLIGEYAVLAGEPCLVAAIGPRFRLHAGEAAAPEAAEAPPVESPAGRLLAWAHARGLSAPPFRCRFEDPHGGRGGFGASTAQFGLLYQWLRQQPGGEGLSAQWQRVWALYRELTAGAPGIPPSGADLVAQWKGGLQCFDPEERSALDLSAFVDGHRFLVFSATAQAGRKTATHEHLARLAGTGVLRPDSRALGRLREPLTRALEAARERDPHALGQALTDYADALGAEGLEDARARADRLALLEVPGVLGAKGCGAMLSDAVVVMVGSEPARAQAVAVAESRGLCLVRDGIAPEMGVSQA